MTPFLFSPTILVKVIKKELRKIDNLSKAIEIFKKTNRHKFAKKMCGRNKKAHMNFSTREPVEVLRCRGTSREQFDSNETIDDYKLSEKP